MNAKSNRKLSLHRATLRQLSVTEMGEIGGASLISRDFDRCISAGCTQEVVRGCIPKVLAG